MNRKHLPLLSILCLLCSFYSATAQHSVARLWNEALLDAIRTDPPRPTVHARNLFHTAVVMYDAWAAYDDIAEPFLLGKTVGGFACAFDGVNKPANLKAARDEAVSYASYRLLLHRFKNSPGSAKSLASFDSLMVDLGYDISITSTNYSTGSPAALGNYIAECMIIFGFLDGSNEQANYADVLGYTSVNPPVDPTLPGDQGIADLNRWQPIAFPQGSQPFLGPHWGLVVPFALTEDDLTVYERDGADYWVYHDPGKPPYIDSTGAFVGLGDDYKWTHTLVAVWSGHLDPNDGVMWDISPASMGALPSLPQTIEEMRDFYDLLNGGQPWQGYQVNPRTGQPYQPNMVPRGDFGRVIAEFWADGPNSETPPGHWFTLLNYVNDHPLFEKRFKGKGPILDDLEWDVKAYLALGGAVHDVAVAVWGMKSWYDYIRPISAIRCMANYGQCSDPNRLSYHPAGIPLVEGYIDIVEAGDLLAGENNENVGKIKLKAWRGPAYIENPETDLAGVDWILADNWWPYQRPNFVTPPFAGYVSGHSTFSRAAAEVLTLLTGDEYFPGGLGEFHAAQNEYLVFEEGPSVDVVLQWAKYREASDQASLSRLWGGIHPPIDDIPGRQAGAIMGPQAFHHAERYFTGQVTGVETPSSVVTVPTSYVYPNPVSSDNVLTLKLQSPASGSNTVVQMYNMLGQLVYTRPVHLNGSESFVTMNTSGMSSGVYMLRVIGRNWQTTHRILIMR